MIRQDQSKPRVTERFLVKFSNVTKNIDVVPCRVINTIVCHLLLGRPWESHQDSYYSSTNNTHSFFIRHKKAILDFLDFSGLRLNRAKSTFVGFGLSEEEMSGCSQILAMPIGVLPIRRLAMLVDRRLRIQDWQHVFDKVETRLGGWRARLLSRGGHLILLKAVLAAIPIYYISIFTMPAGVRRRLERIMPSFLWRGSQPDEVQGTVLVAWSIVCWHVTQGGLCIRHLQHTNMALLAKWVRRMMQISGDLATVVLRDAYRSSLDWEMWRTSRRGDSAFMSSVRTCFPQV